MAAADTPRSRGESDVPQFSPIAPDDDARTILINEVSWGAVFAGVALALTVQLLLNMLGVAFGAASVDPATSNNPSATAFSIGAGVWWGVSTIIAAFAGGIAAGRMAGTPKESTAAWHGIISWAFTTLFIFYLVGAVAGGLVMAATQTMGNVVSGLGQAAGGAVLAVSQGGGSSGTQAIDPFSSIEQSVRSATGGQDPASVRDAAVSAVRAALTGDQARRDAARTRAADILARAESITPEQARAQVQQYETQYNQAVEEAKRQATQIAETARRSIASASLLAVVALVLGAIAAWYGGRMGAVNPTVTSDSLRAIARRMSR